MSVEFIAPFERAWARMLRLLFRPFELRTWLLIGFSAWLGGAGGCRGSVSSRGWSPTATDVGGDMDRVGSWLGSHLWLVLAIVVPVIVVVVVVALVWLWLRAHGWFVFLDNVVRERAEIAAAWSANSSLANSAFLWNIGFGFAVLIAMCLLILPVVFAALSAAAGAPPIGLLLTVVPMVVLIAVVAGCVKLFFTSFVIPIMYRHRLKAVPAWGRFLVLLRSRIGSFALYVVVAILAAVGFGMTVVLAGFLTCCIAFIPLLIPYVGTVILLPAWVTWRAFSLEFLAQFGSEFDLLATENERIQPM